MQKSSSSSNNNNDDNNSEQIHIWCIVRTVAYCKFTFFPPLNVNVYLLFLGGGIVALKLGELAKTAV